MVGARSNSLQPTFSRIKEFILFFVLVLVAGACSTNNATDEKGPDEEEPVEKVPCELSAVLDNLEETRPDWDTIDCLAKDTPVNDYPDFAARVLVSSQLFEQKSGLVDRHLDFWEKIRTEESVELSSANMVAMPPYADEQGNPLEYPLTPEWHDEVLRGAIPAMMREKRSGLPVLLQNLYPNDMLGPTFESADDFRTWMEDHFLPEKEREAKAVARAGIEAYGPFPIEIEVYFNPVDQPILNELPKAELVSLAQEWVTATLEVVRPLYEGRIVAHSYSNYKVWGEEWEDLSFPGYDEVAFSLFPECNMPTTESYLEKQINAYVHIAKRDNIPWSIGELGINRAYFENCGTNFDAIEADVYRAVFEAVDAAEPATMGMGISWVPGERPEVDEVIRGYYQLHTK
ncbi:MAG: hypothetical protein FH748_11620 [Balneolaceae bacterium]|nr:hypothetical protein [Balneolaceae bacterium]